MGYRIKEYDFLKGFAIVLVVLAHYAYRNLGEINSISVYSYLQFVHMPIFFLVSGIFSYKKILNISLLQFIHNRVIRLFIPYLTWSSIAFIMRLLLIFIAGEMSFDAFIRNSIDIYFYGESLWFLLTLFIINIFSKILVDIFLKNKFVFLILLCCITLFPIQIRIFSLYKVQEFLLIFMLGFILSSKKGIVFLLKERTIFNVGFSIIFFLILSTSLLNDSFSLWIVKLLTTILTDIFSLYISVTILYPLFKKIKFNSFLEKLGQFTLEIYCIHMMFIKYLRIPVPSFITDIFIFQILCYVIISVVICLLCVWTSRLVPNLHIFNIILWGKTENNCKKQD